MHIGIAGNIGSGKTTLTRKLAEHYGWVPKYESVTFNPYLEDYYKDISRWSYNLETYFLAQRFQVNVKLKLSRRPSKTIKRFSKSIMTILRQVMG